MPRLPPSRRRDRAVLVWLLLVAATALSWSLGTHRVAIGDPRAIGVAVLAIGFVKARFVALDFMELRHAPLALRLVMEAWILGAFALLATLFLLG